VAPALQRGVRRKGGDLPSSFWGIRGFLKKKTFPTPSGLEKKKTFDRFWGGPERLFLGGYPGGRGAAKNHPWFFFGGGQPFFFPRAGTGGTIFLFRAFNGPVLEIRKPLQSQGGF